MNELALFSGAGGGILAGLLLGWRTICAVERDLHAASVLIQRQNDGYLAPFPIWSDVQGFDGAPWRGAVDIISGGFPCQDISTAGAGAGISGTRSGLWSEMVRIICEVRPRYVFMENSSILTARGLGTLLGDLAKIGFNASWCVLGAKDVGAPHIRKRMWILAHTNSLPLRHNQQWKDARRESVQNSRETELGNHGKEECLAKMVDPFKSIKWWQTQPRVDRVVDGLAHRVDRLKVLGNGQVPAVAATAFILLRRRLEEQSHVLP